MSHTHTHTYTHKELITIDVLGICCLLFVAIPVDFSFKFFHMNKSGFIVSGEFPTKYRFTENIYIILFLEKAHENKFELDKIVLDNYFW